jgi:hypothetical protein
MWVLVSLTNLQAPNFPADIRISYLTEYVIDLFQAKLQLKFILVQSI